MEYSILTLTFCLSVVTVCAQGPGELNDGCRTIVDCRDFGYLCARNFTCQCLVPIYIPNRNRDKCVGIVGQTCKYDEHCIDGAFCLNQTKCKCKDYFYPNNDGSECSSKYFSNSNTIVPKGYLILLLIMLCYSKFCL